MFLQIFIHHIFIRRKFKIKYFAGNMTGLEFFKSLWQKNRCSLTNYNKISMSIFLKPEILLV